MSSKTVSRLTPPSADAFRRACAQFATGITVATVLGRDGIPSGMTANSFTSVSCCPPMVLICIAHGTTALAEFRANPVFGINVLAAEQRHLSVHFAAKRGDRFAGIDWQLSDLGVPLLTGVLATFECSVTQAVEAGDHTILIGEVLRTEAGPSGRPLLYFDSRYAELPG